MDSLYLTISKDGMILYPNNFPSDIIKNGFSMFFEKSKNQSNKFNKLVIYNFNKYKIMNIHDPLITESEFNSAYNPFNFNKYYNDNSDIVSFTLNDMGCSYNKLLKDNQLNTNNYNYIYNGHINYDKDLYNYYSTFDYKSLHKLLFEEYPWPPKWPYKELDNVVTMFHKYAKSESMEFVFDLSKPNKIIRL